MDSRTKPNLCAARFLLKPGRRYEESVKLFEFVNFDIFSRGEKIGLGVLKVKDAKKAFESRVMARGRSRDCCFFRSSAGPHLQQSCLPEQAGLVSVKDEWEFANGCPWCVDLRGMDHNAIGVVGGC